MITLLFLPCTIQYFYLFCPDTCVVNGHTYRTADTFASSDCLSKCTCHPEGEIFCMPLCSSQRNTCKLDEMAVQVQEIFSNTNCTCPALKCVKNNQTISVVGPSAQGI